ncbi:MAG: hypothetical protein H8E37_00785, partial [Planctomycetes bacterium]|nr:hypothetical protein [Planctomycetota bacterium]
GRGGDAEDAEPITQGSALTNDRDQVPANIEEEGGKVRPRELEPYRGRMFELFVVADGAGLLDEKLEPNLTSDEIARVLADRWDLRESDAAAKLASGNMAGESLSKMRLLWSFLRMWMEWTYAWHRWQEFHDDK